MAETTPNPSFAVKAAKLLVRMTEQEQEMAKAFLTMTEKMTEIAAAQVALSATMNELSELMKERK